MPIRISLGLQLFGLCLTVAAQDLPAPQTSTPSGEYQTAEGQHGGQKFLLLDTDLKPLSAWQPPHPSDSAYACMAVASPVLAGRVFIRGHDGLYCYDLRK